MELYNHVNYFREETEEKVIETQKMFLDSKIPTELQWVCDSIIFILKEIDIVASIYMKWGMTINGLEVASNMYRTEAWKKKYPGMINHFYIEGYRSNSNTQNIESGNLVLWNGDKASKAHRDAIPMIASSAIVDIYRHIENSILELYRIYLLENPFKLISTDNELKELYNGRRNSDEEDELWLEKINIRIDKWWKNKSYKSNLGGIVEDYFNDIKIEESISDENIPFILEEVINILKFIIEIRNSLVHNEKYVSTDLVTLGKSTNFENFIGKELVMGEELDIRLIHLQYVDYSTNRIFNTFYMLFMGLLIDE